MRCDQVHDELPGVVDGTTVLGRRAARHAAGCLRCQAELAHYRRLRRSMRQMADHPRPAPAGLNEAVIAALPAYPGWAGAPVVPAAPNPWTRRAAYAAGVAATAVTAAGATALVLNRRRLRLAAG